MINTEYELRAPANAEEWRALHNIRRKVLFENRGKVGTYIENHPDDFKAGHYPLVLFYRGVAIGVVRVEVDARVAWFRRVAIREDLQGLGHGRVLLQLAEEFAKAKGCDEVRSNAAVEAVGFYDRCGYARDPSATAPANSVPVLKVLRYIRGSAVARFTVLVRIFFIAFLGLRSRLYALACFAGLNLLTVRSNSNLTH